jgi:hypothetical protein
MNDTDIFFLAKSVVDEPVENGEGELVLGCRVAGCVRDIES